MRTREEHIKPWGYISPFAKKSLQDSAMCDLTVTRKSTVSTTMPLYTEDQLREAERRAEQRVRAELSRAVKDADRFLWIAKAHTPEYEEYVNICDFRLYIDSLRAREALMDMSIKFSDDVKYELFGNGGSNTTS